MVMQKHNVQSLDELETAVQADYEARIMAQEFINKLI